MAENLLKFKKFDSLRLREFKDFDSISTQILRRILVAVRFQFSQIFNTIN